MKKWKILEQEDVFKGPWYHLRKDTVQLPDGKVIDDYYVSVRPEVVITVALTENEEVLLVRQYKHGLQNVVTEVPGGFFNPNEEKAEEAAARELLEETGYQPSQMEKIARLSDNPTKDTNYIHVFLARGCKKIQEQNLDITESIDILKVSTNDLLRLIKDGHIITSGTIAAIYMALEIF